MKLTGFIGVLLLVKVVLAHLFTLGLPKLGVLPLLLANNQGVERDVVVTNSNS